MVEWNFVHICTHNLLLARSLVPCLILTNFNFWLSFRFASWIIMSGTVDVASCVAFAHHLYDKLAKQFTFRQITIMMFRSFILLFHLLKKMFMRFAVSVYVFVSKRISWFDLISTGRLGQHTHSNRNFPVALSFWFDPPAFLHSKFIYGRIE